MVVLSSAAPKGRAQSSARRRNSHCRRRRGDSNLPPKRTDSPECLHCGLLTFGGKGRFPTELGTRIQYANLSWPPKHLPLLLGRRGPGRGGHFNCDFMGGFSVSQIPFA